MKLNIAYPATGLQKLVEVEDESKLRGLFDKRISHEVDGDFLGEEYKGYIFRISGGNDKQGFPMLQGVLTSARVSILFREGMKCYRQRKDGERKRKSVRGCIVSSDLSVINLVVVKKGEGEIAGLTDFVNPRRLGPKRASRIRRLFNLEKKDDVRQYVIRRTVTPKPKEAKEGEPAPKVKKPYTKAPKIQRLVTPQRLQRKRHEAHVKKARWEKSRKQAEEYNKVVSQRLKDQREARAAKAQKKRSLSRAHSQTAEKKGTADKTKEAPKPKPAQTKPAVHAKPAVAPAAVPSKAPAPVKAATPAVAKPAAHAHAAAPKKDTPAVAKPAQAAAPKKEASKPAPKPEAPKKAKK